MNVNAIDLLEKNQDKISYYYLGKNTNIYTIDYKYCKERMDIHREELMKKVFHPRRLSRYLEMGYSFDELFL